MVHAVKCLPQYFGKTAEGNKYFEVRRKDRPYKVGDMLALNEWTEEDGYTGNSALFVIVYILDDEKFVKDGYVIMSLQPCEVKKSDKVNVLFAKASNE